MAMWPAENLPEGLVVLALPATHRRRLRRANPVERGAQQELKRRTLLVRVVPNVASLAHLVTALLLRTDKEWAATPRPGISGMAASAPAMAYEEEENERA